MSKVFFFFKWRQTLICLPDGNNRFSQAKMSSEYESFHCNEQKLTESNGVYTTGNLSEIKNKGKKK